jgi:hypothetical protein
MPTQVDAPARLALPSSLTLSPSQGPIQLSPILHAYLVRLVSMIDAAIETSVLAKAEHSR